ncbi:MAG TPA: YdcF family protein [Vicinamibacterales bacterium]|nr:YdcF family protein [Vicinamibacterales bacterium]
MNPIVEFIKEFLIPGSAWFLLIAATASALLLFGAEGKRRLARILLASLVALYWVISVPVVAHGLQTAQRGRTAQPVSHLPAAPLPIVVLGNGVEGYAAFGGRIELPGGRTAMNTLFALDRFRAYPRSMMIASGGVVPPRADAYPEGAVIRDALIRNQVPADHIIVEGTSTTTHEQAVASARILKQLGASSCIVATSPQQMGRAIDLFAHEGINALPLYVTSLPWTIGEAAPWWEWVLPSTAARAVSRDVIYELLAWPYYRMRGWVG